MVDLLSVITQLSLFMFFSSLILSLLDTQNVHEMDLYVFLSELPKNGPNCGSVICLFQHFFSYLKSMFLYGIELFRSTEKWWSLEHK